MTAATISTNVYPRNRVMTTLMVVNTLLFGFLGITNITQGKPGLSMIWFCGAVVFYINFIWSKKTPFIQFTDEGLILAAAMMRPKRMLNWSDIASLQQVSEKKVSLTLKDGEQLKIALFSVNKEDRVPLVRRLESQITHKT